jgi:dipeptidase D
MILRRHDQGNARLDEFPSRFQAPLMGLEDAGTGAYQYGGSPMSSRSILGSSVVFLTSFLPGCFAHQSSQNGDVTADEVVAADARCDEDCVVAVFKDLSKVFRPSFKEDKARNWVRNEVQAAKSAWGSRASGLTVESDQSIDPEGHAISNLLVRVPGTGRFQDRRSVALNGHLDIVLAVKDVPPGTSLEAFYENGVDVVEDDLLGADGSPTLGPDGKPVRILHSRDFKTTLGADAGCIVSMMVRYIRDPNLEHPPLELLFTAAEETGLFGARQWDEKKLPLKATAIIGEATSLKDETTPEWDVQPLRVARGANGGITSNIDGVLPKDVVGQDAKIVDLTLSGLQGGHSGMSIHLKRLNSMKALASVLEKARQLDPRARLARAEIGEVAARKGINKIPNAFTARLALSADTDLAAFRATLSTFVTDLVRPFTDEIHASIRFEVVDVEESVSSALSPKSTTALSKAISDSPNGIVIADDAFPGRALSSSNLGILGITPNEQSFAMYVGFMPRSFDIEKAAETERTVNRAFEVVAREGGIPVQGDAFAKFTRVVSQPWLSPLGAPIEKLVLSLKASDGKPLIRESYLIGGSTEPGEFARKFPVLKDRALGFGPAITRSHTPRELVGVDSFKRATAALQAMLVTMAEDPTFLR